MIEIWVEKINDQKETIRKYEEEMVLVREDAERCIENGGATDAMFEALIGLEKNLDETKSLLAQSEAILKSYVETMGKYGSGCNDEA